MAGACRRDALRAALLGATLLALAMAVPASADAARRLFSPTSYLNKPLAPNARIDPSSSLMVRHVIAQVDAHTPVVENRCYGSPVWTVKRHARRVRVRPTGHNPKLARQWAHVPLPKRAKGACGTDGHLTVWQPSTDTLWEFFRFVRKHGRARAEFGGRMRHVSRNPGYFTDPPGTRFGATATSIPLLAGLQRISELKRGRIDHALAFGMARPAPCFRWPAERQDADHSANDRLAPPEGARLRLPASLNLDALGLTPYGLVVARAVQRYGMVLRDRTANTVGFYAEAPHGRSDPYPGIFGGLRSDGSGVLRNFPWTHLQVLAPHDGDHDCHGGTVVGLPLP